METNVKLGLLHKNNKSLLFTGKYPSSSLFMSLVCLQHLCSVKQQRSVIITQEDAVPVPFHVRRHFWLQIDWRHKLLPRYSA